MSQEQPIAGLSAGALRQAVATRYGQVALDPAQGFGFPVGRAFAEAVGYPRDLLDPLPPAATASFTGVTYLPAWAGLDPGQVVVDLGCGAGVDALIAAGAVAPNGSVHAVDLAPPMVELARANARALALSNVVVHQGAVEALPLGDAVADVVTANGVFNLAPEKERAAAEAWRVLKPGGRLVAAEIVLSRDLPASERSTLDDWFR